MATSAAMAPLAVMPMSGLPIIAQAVIMAASTPATAAMFVTRAISAKLRSMALSVLPGLKPNQPSQRMTTPRSASGILWPGMGFGLPSLPYLPILGPRATAPTSAEVAPSRWTTVEPAKSCMPSCESQPPPQIQWPTTG